MTWADIVPLSKIIEPRKVAKEPYYGEPVCRHANSHVDDHHLALDVDLDLVGLSELGSAVISGRVIYINVCREIEILTDEYAEITAGMMM